MSTVLSSRIVASRSPTATEVAHDKDVVEALMAEVVLDEPVVAAIVDDDDGHDVRVAVAKTTAPSPKAAKPAVSKQQPKSAVPGQMDTVASPPTVKSQSAEKPVTAIKNTATGNSLPNSSAEAQWKTKRSSETAASDNVTPASQIKKRSRKASGPSNAEVKMSGQPIVAVADSAQQSVDADTVVDEATTATDSIAIDRPLEPSEAEFDVSDSDISEAPSPPEQTLTDPAPKPRAEDIKINITTKPPAKTQSELPKKRQKTGPGRPTTMQRAVDFSAVELSNPTPAPVLTYGEWFRENVLQSKWMTSFFAFYAHWLLLIVLALLVVHGPNTRGDFTITASNVTPLEYEPVDVIDTRIVEPEPEVSEVNSRTSPTLPIDMSVNSPTLPDAFMAEETAPGAVDEPNKTDAPPSQVASLSPTGAVKQGSFSVWTVPEFPDPGESYKVVIQAKVPEGVTRYPVNDLQGVVVGSDGYRKLIPGSIKGYLPIRGGYVQFEVPIVAANQEIKDTVWIQSKMLKEQQQLVIEF